MYLYMILCVRVGRFSPSVRLLPLQASRGPRPGIRAHLDFYFYPVSPRCNSAETILLLLL